MKATWWSQIYLCNTDGFKLLRKHVHCRMLPVSLPAWCQPQSGSAHEAVVVLPLNIRVRGHTSHLLIRMFSMPFSRVLAAQEGPARAKGAKVPY